MSERVDWEKEWLEEQRKKAEEVFREFPTVDESFSSNPLPHIEHTDLEAIKKKRGAKTGARLLDDLKNLEITRKPIIEEFLYERDIFMMSADSGVGKSTITAQLALSLSSGTPLFGALKTRKTKTYVIQVEGDYEESIERMRHMMNVVPVDADYLCWHENRKLDISCREGIEHALYEIESNMKEPGVVIIDPIYKLSSKDICTGEGALMVVNFSDAIYEKFNCTVVLIHHNTKENFTIVGGNKEQKADAYYGHSFIKNHIRTSYALSRNKETDQPHLIRKKGRGGDTLSHIELIYEPMTMTCALASEDKNFDALSRVLSFLEVKKKLSGKTDFNEVMLNCRVSQAQLRKLKPKFAHKIQVSTEAKGKQIWKPL